jgi:hypothetical protein
LEALIGWVPITGVTAGERVVTDALELSSEFEPEFAAIADTLM